MCRTPIMTKKFQMKFVNKYYEFSSKSKSGSETNSNAIGKLTLIKFRNQFIYNLESNLNLVQKQSQMQFEN